MSYLIKDTTKEQRQKIISDALSLATLDAPAPSAKAAELYNRYIEGEIELKDVKKLLLSI